MRPLVQFLRFVLNLQGAAVQGASLLPSEGEVEVMIRRHGSAKPRCPKCNDVLGGRITTHRRRWRHLDLIRTKTWLCADIREGYCRRHGRRVESVPWAAPSANHTHRFDRAVASFVQVADKTAATRSSTFAGGRRGGSSPGSPRC